MQFDAQGVVRGEKYAESLPDQCPPSNAINTDERMVLRLVKNSHFSESDFYSHAKLNKPLPKDVCECRWASCSVFSLPEGKHVAQAISKLPKVRDRKYVATIKLSPIAGKMEISSSRRGHIEFWMYDSFNLKDSICEVKELGK